MLLAQPGELASGSGGGGGGAAGVAWDGRDSQDGPPASRDPRRSPDIGADRREAALSVMCVSEECFSMFAEPPNFSVRGLSEGGILPQQG